MGYKNSNTSPDRESKLGREEIKIKKIIESSRASIYNFFYSYFIIYI
tara:strand:+ start:1713 stop:1853 length:141 start_codon:yes stop_codon:yes gene_type:complete